MSFDVVSGQLAESERVIGLFVAVGSRGEEKIGREADFLKGAGHNVIDVRRLRTIENDLSSDDPEYDPGQNVERERWCAIIKVED